MLEFENRYKKDVSIIIGNIKVSHFALDFVVPYCDFIL